MDRITIAKNIVENKILKRGFRIKYRTSLSGCVYWSAKICSMPIIKTRKSLYIGCHELYHCLRPRNNIKVYIDEMQAEKFAHKYMRHLGFSVPRSQTRGAKFYIKYKLRQAIDRGLKKVDSKIKEWING